MQTINPENITIISEYHENSLRGLLLDTEGITERLCKMIEDSREYSK